MLFLLVIISCRMPQNSLPHLQITPKKNNAAAYDFSDFFPFPAFLSLSAVFNTSADLYKKNPAASLTFLQSSLFQNPIPGSSKSEYPEMGISKISRQKKPVNLFIMYPQYRKM